MKVSEVLRMLQEDGWELAATRGSHRQYKHPIKPGRVTVPGKPSDEFGARHAERHSEAVRLEEVRFACATPS